LNPAQGQSFYKTSIGVASAGLKIPIYDPEDQGYLFPLSSLPC